MAHDTDCRLRRRVQDLQVQARTLHLTDPLKRYYACESHQLYLVTYVHTNVRTGKKRRDTMTGCRLKPP